MYTCLILGDNVFKNTNRRIANLPSESDRFPFGGHLSLHE
jgi:hypothetical protein